MILFFSVFAFLLVLMHYICFLQSFALSSFLLRLLPLLIACLFIFLLFVVHKYNGFGAAFLHIFVYGWLGFIFLWFCLSMLFMFLKICHLDLPIYLPFVIALLLTFISTWTAFKTPLIKQMEISSEKIKQPVLIAQISDTHLGKNIFPKRFEKALKKMEEYNPDIIVFTGDVFEETQNMQPYIELIKNLNAPCGKYVISGNHEYYGGLAQNKKIF